MICILEPGPTLAHFLLIFGKYWRARLKNMFLYVMSIECAHGCSVVDWLSLRLDHNLFFNVEFFTLSRLEIRLQIQQRK